MKTKEKILNKLSDKFEVYNIGRVDDEDICLVGKFMWKGREGSFAYVLEGRERGIYSVKGFSEIDNEDVYDEIHDWVEENIDWTTIVKCNGKEIK